MCHLTKTKQILHQEVKMAQDRKQKMLDKAKTNPLLQSSQIINHFYPYFMLLQTAWLSKLIFNLNVWF